MAMSLMRRSGAGHAAVALARSEAAATAVARRGGQPLVGDFDDPARLPEAFSTARCEALVNLASLGFGNAPAIVTAACAASIDRAVFVSTTAVTTTLPARSKQVRLAAEREIRESGLRWTILRPTMIYGTPGDRNLSRLLTLLPWVPLVPVPGGGRHLQQPVHVADVAGRRAERRGASRRRRRTATTWPGRSRSASPNCCGSAARAVGSRARFVPVPLAPLVAAARCYEVLSARPGSGPSRCSDWPRIRRSSSTTPFAISAIPRDHLPTAYWPKFAHWDWRPERGRDRP